MTIKNGVLFTIAIAIAFLSNYCSAQPAFQHIIVLVQENRTPDNLFCAMPNDGRYNLKCFDWKDKKASGGLTQPHAAPLVTAYDLGHGNYAAKMQYDNGKMDGAAVGACTPSSACPSNSHFGYVQSQDVQPYFNMALQYGFANYMFQSNRGPSFPAHQYLWGGTSADSTADDALNIFASENPTGSSNVGCASTRATVQLIRNGVETPGDRIPTCFEHQTLGDLLDAASVSWRYYTPSAGSIWTAPNAIAHECQAAGGKCLGSDWLTGVDVHNGDVLKDIAAGTLRQVSYVIPSGQCSDHALTNSGCGPAWVASIVNAVGNSAYWQDTAILVTWDDWGGWYDHEVPTINANGYEGGFRVPLLFVSAYTAPGTVSNVRSDFGSILRFVEGNFGISEGALGFADARASSDLSEMYDLTAAPRSYSVVAAPFPKGYNAKTAPSDPDDDEEGEM